MIEYDKAGASTSYPSLTEYEIATFLDKAYNALIAQKVTGNNYRRTQFEQDVKAISDLTPLVVTVDKEMDKEEDIDEKLPTNAFRVSIKEEDKFLYFVQAQLSYGMDFDTEDEDIYKALPTLTPYSGKYKPVDGVLKRMLPVRLVDHQTAQKFLPSAYNIPWIKEPVCYIENNKIYFLTDPLNWPDFDPGKLDAKITYIKKPNTFVKDLTKFDTTVSYFNDGGKKYEAYNFECNSTVAEELVSLAVAFALENVESQRLNAKLNMRGLEA